MAALGFASGLPYSITNETASVRLAELKIDPATIGLIGAIAGVYSLKFLWAAIVDARPVPGLASFGRRRSWLLATQIPLIIAIAALAWLMPPEKDSPLLPMAITLFAIGALSATQDIVVGAWTVDAFPKRELGIGSAMTVAGYRIALLVGGLFALSIAKRLGWPAAFLALAAMMSIGMVVTLFSREPAVETPPPQPLMRAFRAPIIDLARRIGFGLVIVTLFVLVYRLPDQLGNPMQKSLLLDTLGYEKEQYGVFRNAVGLGAMLLGAFLGGGFVARFGLLRTLLIGAMLQALSNLGFAWLAQVVVPLHGNVQPWLSWPMQALTLVSGIENLCGGFVGTAFVAYLATLCTPRYAATQYALLTGVMAFAGAIASERSGHLANFLNDWPAYFAWTAVAGVPGAVLVYSAVRCLTRDSSFRAAEQDPQR